MKKPWSILKTIFVGVVALVGGGFLLAGLFVVMLLLGGPYSDSQFSPRRYSPIANITILQSSVQPLLWDVDERFVVEFDDGFVLKQGMKLSDFPENLAVKDGWIHYDSGKQFAVYTVREAGVRVDCMSVTVDAEKMVVRADVAVDGHKGVKFKDLKSQKSIRLHNNTYDDLVAFFKSLPK